MEPQRKGAGESRTGLLICSAASLPGKLGQVSQPQNLQLAMEGWGQVISKDFVREYSQVSLVLFPASGFPPQVQACLTSLCAEPRRCLIFACQAQVPILRGLAPALWLCCPCTETLKKVWNKGSVNYYVSSLLCALSLLP
jgi:hypothetical protein